MKTTTRILYGIGIAIIVVAILLLIFGFRSGPKFDPLAGFPLNPKEGDKFILDNNNYIYTNGGWVALDPGAFPATPKEGDTFVINGITFTYTNGRWV